ncbi:MAG: hypothetical protein AAF804_09090, partial [Bacteroidota bacterium]
MKTYLSKLAAWGLILLPLTFFAQTKVSLFSLKNGHKTETYLFSTGDHELPFQLIFRKQKFLRSAWLDTALQARKIESWPDLPPEVALFPVIGIQDLGDQHRFFFEKRLADEISVVDLHKEDGTARLKEIDLVPPPTEDRYLKAIGQFSLGATFYCLLVDKPNQSLVIKTIDQDLEVASKFFPLTEIPSLTRLLTKEREYPLPILVEGVGMTLATQVELQKIYVEDERLVISHEDERMGTTHLLINHLSKGWQKHETYVLPDFNSEGKLSQLNSTLYNSNELYQISYRKKGALSLYRRNLEDGSILAKKVWRSEEELDQDFPTQEIARRHFVIEKFPDRDIRHRMH